MLRTSLERFSILPRLGLRNRSRVRRDYERCEIFRVNVIKNPVADIRAHPLRDGIPPAVVNCFDRLAEFGIRERKLKRQIVKRAPQNRLVAA